MSALTKIFIVLQLVCSLVVAVVLVTALKNQENYKKDAEARNTLVNQQNAALQKKNNELAAQQTEYERLVQDLRNTTGTYTQKINDLIRDKGEIAIERDKARAESSSKDIRISELTSSVDTLTKVNQQVMAENNRLAPEVAKYTQQNAELSRANQEAATQIQFHEKAIRKLQEALAQAQASKGGAAVSGDSGTVAQLTTQTPALINGKVTQSYVSAGRTLVEVGLGARDGVKEGAKYTISRNGTFIAEAVVTRVTPNESLAATTNNVVKGETVMAGDLVESGAAR